MKPSTSSSAAAAVIKPLLIQVIMPRCQAAASPLP